jgi:hypothetical protein
VRFGIKYVSSVAVATAVLAGTAACGGSSKPALTADQVNAQLLTAKDEPGWNFDPDADQRSTPDRPETVTSGGSACQTFLDAGDLLSTKYGTTDDILRTFPAPSGPQNLLDDVAVMPSKAKAAALMSDLATGLKGCTSYVTTGTNGATTVRADAGAPAGHVAFTMTATIRGDITVVTSDTIQVGEEVVTISYLGGAADDSAKVWQTVSHASEVQAARLKAAQG